MLREQKSVIKVGIAEL